MKAYKVVGVPFTLYKQLSEFVCSFDQLREGQIKVSTEVTIELGLQRRDVDFSELAPVHVFLALRQFARGPDECFYQSASPRVR